MLQKRFKNRDISKLNHREKEFYNSVSILTEFHLTGKITTAPRMHRIKYVFDGPVGKAIACFLEYKKVEDRLLASRLITYQRYLYLFYQHCNEKNVYSFEEIDLTFALQFIREVDHRKVTAIQMIISSLRNFIKYAFEKKLILTDFSRKLPRYKNISQPQIPSTYSKLEIEKLIHSVDRSTPIGKRNYAIILIAARLGIRSSDICRLKFENINWEKSIIDITQKKTGKELALPLLPDVGNAIIDYLKYARPKSEEPNIFLTVRPPHEPFPAGSVITQIVQRAFRDAGINVKDKKFGPHALRHSLGFRLLEENTILPVISEVLGHQNSESTRYYLRIDLQSMKQCTLEVPPVANSFYKQKAGGFYA